MYTNGKTENSIKLNVATKKYDLRKTGPIIFRVISGQLTKTMKDGCHVCCLSGRAFVFKLEAKNR